MAGPVFGYRPDKNRKFIPTGIPVNVIASFKPSGEFIPIYFQVNDDNGERFSFKINSVDSIKDKAGLKIFICSFIANEEKHTVALQYEIETARWLLV